MFHDALKSSGTTLLTKMLSWTGGPNLSCVLYKLSMTIPSTHCYMWNAMYYLMNPKLSLNKEHNSALSSNKVPGSDIIPTYFYKVGGQPMTEKPSELFYCIWRKEAIPQEFNDVAIIHPYIRKGNAQVCDSHRGISLLYCLLPGRYWPNLQTRLHEYLDQAEILPVSQC